MNFCIQNSKKTLNNHNPSTLFRTQYSFFLLPGLVPVELLQLSSGVASNYKAKGQGVNIRAERGLIFMGTRNHSILVILHFPSFFPGGYNTHRYHRCFNNVHNVADGERAMGGGPQKKNTHRRFAAGSQETPHVISKLRAWCKQVHELRVLGI